jgi:4,5-dihydroxyphthalate decarboxylase
VSVTELTIALNRYDRHVPFFNGTVEPPRGIRLRPLEVGESSVYRDGTARHERMMGTLEFDISEMSLSSFIMAFARDPDLPMVAIPVIPRRFFSVGQMYVHAGSGIERPADLVGRRVGLHAFQTTLSVLGKGDLKADYGVPWESISWFCMRPELVPVDLGPDVQAQVIPKGTDIGLMLCQGEIDALISPQPRPSMLERPDAYRRLFADPRAEEVAYFRRHGFYPIMHLVVMKRSVAERHPELPRELMATFEAAKRLAWTYYEDSNYALLVDARNLIEEQRATFGNDPWPYGLRANRRNLEEFIGYAHDQRLIDAPFAAERLFHPSTRDT